MSGYFISRSGMRHILGPPDAKRPGRLVGLCGFSARADDEEAPGEAVQDCGWCLEVEEQARQIAQAALEAAGQAQQNPEASA